jgi:hypothetical protein
MPVFAVWTGLISLVTYHPRGVTSSHEPPEFVTRKTARPVSERSGVSLMYQKQYHLHLMPLTQGIAASRFAWPTPDMLINPQFSHPIGYLSIPAPALC